MFHNLFLLEVIFVITFVYHIFVSDFYQTFFYILVGILIIENIFVLYKIFKKQFLHPRLTFRLAFTILVLLIIETIYFFTIDFIVFLLINICIPLVLI
ncbi:MAG: hypothetical protein LBQ24_01505 [Candidatus Peribacteria bacterium]|nr:hypothetical protein [Candidatus Peribacteria bacterium]